MKTQFKVGDKVVLTGISNKLVGTVTNIYYWGFDNNRTIKVKWEDQNYSLSYFTKDLIKINAQPEEVFQNILCSK